MTETALTAEELTFLNTYADKAGLSPAHAAAAAEMADTARRAFPELTDVQLGRLIVFMLGVAKASMAAHPFDPGAVLETFVVISASAAEQLTRLERTP